MGITKRRKQPYLQRPKARFAPPLLVPVEELAKEHETDAPASSEPFEFESKSEDESNE